MLGFQGAVGLRVDVHAAHRVLHRSRLGRRFRRPAGGHPHAAFGVDQEVARDHDPFAGLEPAGDFHPVAQAPAGFHQPRLEHPGFLLHVDGLPAPRIDDGVGGDRHGVAPLDLELDVDEHVGEQHLSGVVQLEPRLQDARLGIELREGVTHAGLELPALVENGRLRPRRQESPVLLENIGQDPHPADVPDAVELGPLVEPLLGGDVARQDVTGDGGVDLDIGRRDAGLLDILDLAVAHAEVAERIDRVLRDQAGPRFQRPVTGRPPLGRVAAADADQEQLLGSQQIPRVIGGQQLAAPDGAADRVRTQLEDPPVGGRDDAVEPLIVHRHPAGHPQDLGSGGTADLVGAHADQLPLGGADPDRPRLLGAVRAGCGALSFGRQRFQAHAADGTIHGVVGAVLRVHRAGVDGSLRRSG